MDRSLGFPTESWRQTSVSVELSPPALLDCRTLVVISRALSLFGEDRCRVLLLRLEARLQAQVSSPAERWFRKPCFCKSWIGCTLQSRCRTFLQILDTKLGHWPGI